MFLIAILQADPPSNPIATSPWVEELLRQLDLVWNAPAVVLPLAIALIVATWFGVNWLRSQEVRAAKEQAAAYKARLDGATPDEARARIEAQDARIQALEAVVKRTVGSAWTPLTKHQIQGLTRELAGIEKRKLTVMYKGKSWPRLSAKRSKRLAGMCTWQSPGILKRACSSAGRPP